MLEQSNSNRPIYTIYSDIWALGCVLFEIFLKKLCWEFRFELPAKGQIQDKMRKNMKPEFPEECHVPDLWQETVKKCFNYQATERFSAADLQELFEY